MANGIPILVVDQVPQGCTCTWVQNIALCWVRTARGMDCPVHRELDEDLSRRELK